MFDKIVHILIARLSNSSERTLELEEELADGEAGNYVWVGLIANNLGLLEPGGSVKVIALPYTIC